MFDIQDLHYYLYDLMQGTAVLLIGLPYDQRSNNFAILILPMQSSCSIFPIWGRRLPMVKTFSMFAGEKLDLLGEITHFIRENSDSETADADPIECTVRAQ